MDYLQVIQKMMNEFIKAIEIKLGDANFDRTSAGTIKSAAEGGYNVYAFGGTYFVRSSASLPVGKKVLVMAPQNNFKKLVIFDTLSEL